MNFELDDVLTHDEKAKAFVESAYDECCRTFVAPPPCYEPKYMAARKRLAEAERLYGLRT